MANAIDMSRLDGATKEVYADSLISLVPEIAKIQKMCKYVSADKREGNAYHQPVRPTRSHGWTLDSSGTAFAMNPPEPAKTADATISGSSFLLREAISFDAAAKLLQGGSKEARQRAFIGGTSYMVETMTETAAFVAELQALHGQSDVGIVESRSLDSGTSQTFVFSAATFIAALWSGLENGIVEFWNTGGTSRLASEVTVTSVDMDTRSVVFTGLETDLDAVAALANVTTGPKVYLRGTKENGMLGLVSQVSNVGTMHGISAVDYSLWAGNTYNALGGQLSFIKLMRAMNRPAARGLMKDLVAFCHPYAFTDAANDLVSLNRIANKAGGKVSMGAEDLTFYGQTGQVSLVPHILMKPSEVVCFPKDGVIRVGASDLTFTPPGLDEGKYWELLPGHAGIGLRCYWNQAVFFPTPARGLKITGLTNSSD